MSEVTRMPVARHDLYNLVQHIKDTIYLKAEGLSVCEVIGAIELAKIEILEEQNDNE